MQQLEFAFVQHDLPWYNSGMPFRISKVTPKPMTPSWMKIFELSFVSNFDTSKNAFVVLSNPKKAKAVWHTEAAQDLMNLHGFKIDDTD